MARLTHQEVALQTQRRGLKTLLETSQVFRKFVLQIFNDAGIYVPTYSHGSPYDTAYREGRRAMGLEVLHTLKHAYPGILALIEQEGNLLHEAITAAETPDESEDLREPLSFDAADER